MCVWWVRVCARARACLRRTSPGPWMPPGSLASRGGRGWYSAGQVHRRLVVPPAPPHPVPWPCTDPPTIRPSNFKPHFKPPLRPPPPPPPQAIGGPPNPYPRVLAAAPEPASGLYPSPPPATQTPRKRSPQGPIQYKGTSGCLMAIWRPGYTPGVGQSDTAGAGSEGDRSAVRKPKTSESVEQPRLQNPGRQRRLAPAPRPAHRPAAPPPRLPVALPAPRLPVVVAGAAGLPERGACRRGGGDGAAGLLPVPGARGRGCFPARPPCRPPCGGVRRLRARRGHRAKGRSRGRGRDASSTDGRR